ncbi:hypothetical protein LAZ67_10000929 [Cordylochernes scorpioides]|uniref:CCHC-type domain-containing protein n=1 Tax=Cordylochernes scorpioides TaxID=51811 RepID=A0ABY6KVE3_9ARAC|nr:hypothetical protein LAZ67_10000929 [Cordylochernes scorpioides]
MGRLSIIPGLRGVGDHRCGFSEADLKIRKTGRWLTPFIRINFNLGGEPSQRFRQFNPPDRFSELWYNHWNHTMRLANVYFFLSGTARSWFENIEEQKNRKLKKATCEQAHSVLKTTQRCFLVESETTEDLIRRIVREEVRRALNAAPTAPEPSPLETIVREKIGKNLATISNPVQRPQLQYKTQTRVPTRTPRQRYPDQDTSVFNQTPNQRRTDQWRTQDNKPICFHCGRPGHVKRYCRDRQPVDQYELERPKRYIQTRQTTQFNKEHSSRSPNYRRKSPYPNRARSPRRQSTSPGRHTSQSPRRYNLEKN